jgi:hypothetical protein
MRSAAITAATMVATNSVTIATTGAIGSTAIIVARDMRATIAATITAGIAISAAVR